MRSSKPIPIAPFITLILALVVPNTSYAQEEHKSATTAVGHVDLRTSRTLFAISHDRATSLQQYVATADLNSVVYSNRTPSAFQAPAEGRRRSVGRKVVGGVLGGVGGFFGGGYLGAAIEGDRCNCDDPGLRGFLIGAPVGATVGAILGVKFF